MKDLWSYLASTDKPKIIYGMGNGADKILSVFDIYKIKVDGIFASDEFYREGKSFHGMPVERYSDICRKYEDFIVLISFASSLPEVIANIKRIAEQRELYVPCVPVYGDTLFSYEYYTDNLMAINEARSLFCDELSVKIFDNIIQYRLNGKLSCLFDAVSDEEEVWQSILKTNRYRFFADCGAYTGDTAKEFIMRVPDVEKIWAIEPDPRNYRRLCTCTDKRIIHVNKGAWDKPEKVEFNMGAGRGASQSNKGKTITLDFDSLDNIVGQNRVDYIKYDVEGAEEKALLGSKNVIEKNSPDLLISLYHRTEDIFKLVLMLKGLVPNYKFYLRRFECIPDWEINLYAIKD